MGKNANTPLMLLSLVALTAAVALFAFYLFSGPRATVRRRRASPGT